MPGDAWLTLVVLVATFAVLASERVSPEVALAGAVGTLLVTGVVDEAGALSGFASEAAATIAALYVVAGAAAATGALGGLFDRVLSGRHPLARLVGTTAAMSSLIPNTPVVALGAPRVSRWARRAGQPASRYLLPLSFASVLGGVVTVLGTSTNLVVSDGLRRSGLEPLDVFEVTPVGLPVAVAGVALLVFIGPRLVPDRATAADSMRSSARRFQVQMVVDAGGPLAGRLVADADLRHLAGVFLAAIDRGGRVSSVRPETKLSAGDVCIFIGDIDQVLDLHEIPGLTPAEHAHLVEIEGAGTRLYEAVIADQSDLVGSTLRAAGFRSRYGAAVLAVHRPEGDLTGKLGTARLKRGDVLLVLAGPGFESAWRHHHDFALVASSAEPPPPRTRHAWLVSVAAVGLVALAATGTTSLLVAALLAAALVLVGGAIDIGEARRAIDLGVVVTIALSIGLGAAVATSGLGDEMASLLASAGEPLGAIGAIAVVIVATQAVTELLSNNAAAAIMLPAALGTAAELGGDPRAYAIAVLIGASCSFLTPIGYQTNLMVYGLGGYRFRDFTIVGLPLTVLTAVVATAGLAVVY